jgi:hypothetical protein
MHNQVEELSVPQSDLGKVWSSVVVLALALGLTTQLFVVPMVKEARKVVPMLLMEENQL